MSLHMMKKNVYLKLISCFIIFAILLPGCATNPVTGQSELMFMSEPMEVDWGHEMYPSVLWGEVGGGGRYQDPQLEGYLEGIVKDLHANSHRPHLDITFDIQNSSIPNAWAIPGHVSITRGLLAEMENEAQFAFVMGHEMGHVSARHSARQMSRNIMTQLLLASAGIALMDDDNAEWMLALGVVGSSLLLLKYGRDDELQSDRLGVEYMSKIGYDPEEAVDAHKSLERAVQKYMSRMDKKSNGQNFLSELLSTHPRTELRLDEVQRTASSVGLVRLKGDGKNSSKFRRMTAGLREVNKAYFEYDKALEAFENDNSRAAARYIRSAISKNSQQAPFYNLRGIIHADQGDYTRAERDFKQALRIDPGYQPSEQALGMLSFKRANYSQAIPHLQNSLSIFPGNPATSYYIGMSYFKLQRYRDSIAHLKAFSQAVPNHKEIHAYLGAAYEQIYDYPNAYSEYEAQQQIDPYSNVGIEAANRMQAIKSYVGR